MDEPHRIVLGDDLAVSRNHLEIRVDPDLGQAVVIDTSSNGARVNGVRIERAVSVPLMSGNGTQHKGTLIDYVGDAFFASWELEADPLAATHALNFMLAADSVVAQCTPNLELRNDDGSPLRMGWAASLGSVIVRLMPGSVVMVIGDAVNVGFRIASLAGREGRPTLLATEQVRHAAGPFVYGEPETVSVKGRVGAVTIFGVHAAAGGP